MGYYQEACSLIQGMGEVMDNPHISKFAAKWMVVATHDSMLKQLVTPKVALGIYSEMMRHNPGIAAAVDLLNEEGRFCCAGLDLFEVHKVVKKANSIIYRFHNHHEEAKLEAEVDRAFDLMTKMRKNPTDTWYCTT